MTRRHQIVIELQVLDSEIADLHHKAEEAQKITMVLEQRRQRLRVELSRMTRMEV